MAAAEELEADVRVFGRFWLDNRGRLAPQGEGAFGDAVVLSAMTAAMRPDLTLDYVPGAELAGLGMNDLLLVDTAQVAGEPGGLEAFLGATLAGLRPGVLIRFSGIVADEELAGAPEPQQAWNRALRGFLWDNGDYEAVFFNRMFARELGDLIESTLPRFLEDPGSGLWLRKLAPAAAR